MNEKYGPIIMAIAIFLVIIFGFLTGYSLVEKYMTRNTETNQPA